MEINERLNWSVKYLTKMFMFFIALLLSTNIWAQSFSCNNTANLNSAEQTVCQNTDLSFLDKKLNYFFQRAMEVSSAPQKIKIDQLQWLAQIRNPCLNYKECLNKAYQARIDALSNEITSALSKKNPNVFPVKQVSEIEDFVLEPQNNACIKLFLSHSAPSYESNVSNYQFTSHSLDEIPMNLGIFNPNDSSEKKAFAILEGKNGKQIDPAVKITYLRPHEMRFISGNGKYAQETRLRILAWGDFNHDGLEDILFLKDDRFSLNSQMTEWSNWQGIPLPDYIVATRKKGEKLFRIVDYYVYSPGDPYSTTNYSKVDKCIFSTDHDFNLKTLINFHDNIPTLYMKFIN